MISGLQRGAVSLGLGYRLDVSSSSRIPFMFDICSDFLVTSQFTYILSSLVFSRINGGVIVILFLLVSYYTL